MCDPLLLLSLFPLPVCSLAPTVTHPVLPYFILVEEIFRFSHFWSANPFVGRCAMNVQGFKRVISSCSSKSGAA
ncbi:hypothetical protein DL96DRAFT_810849 [Flagelloscypha sp. PMI_526]|nr:hypothetical protein DL96DRAFT_810849 [Flagelloscypha sp. PMI_526]